MIARSKITSALRKLWWLYDKDRKLCLSNANSTCAKCGKTCKKLQVDHIIPIGTFTTWSDYIGRLFCTVDNLQALCSKCHNRKTHDHSD